VYQVSLRGLSETIISKVAFVPLYLVKYSTWAGSPLPCLHWFGRRATVLLVLFGTVETMTGSSMSQFASDIVREFG